MDNERASRRRNLTLSVSTAAARMLKEISLTSVDRGDRVSEGRIFDQLVVAQFFAVITESIKKVLPQVAVSTSDGASWATADRYARVDEIDPASLRISLIEYARARSMRVDYPISASFISNKLCAFLRDGVLVPGEVQSNTWEYPQRAEPGSAVNVLLLFYRGDETPASIWSVADSRCEPEPGSYVICRGNSGTMHGSVTSITHTPNRDLVLTVALSDIPIVEA